MTRRPRIFISAGEASGDRLGSGLARALRERRPDLELLGMGGPLMRREGVRLVQEASEVAVVGIFEVLARLPAILRAMGRLERSLREDRPDLLVPVDFPDFNLRLAARARRADVPVVYFVSPQVWAWRRGRVKAIRRLVRRMLVLFSFEADFYEQAGVPVTVVGHPLAEGLDEARDVERMRDRSGLAAGRPTVALMPGSRPGELRSLLEPMLGAAQRIRASREDVQFLVPLAQGLPAESVRHRLQRAELESYRIHRGDFPRILAACEAGVVASGTASLEAALEGLPIVVVYRVNPLTYALGRSLVRLENVALPNLVAGRRVVPELIQSDCRPERIAHEVLSYLEDPERARETREALLGVRRRLGGPGAFGRAADAVLAELEASGAN
jgi:lipid-A-disaccharide synthase